MTPLARKTARAGHYVLQPTGYKAFIPAPLPPRPEIKIDMEMLTLLSKADRALARLDMAGEIVPNPELFVKMYIRKEAILSSQIEGTQSSLEDVIKYESGLKTHSNPEDLEENINYIEAMNHGLERLKTLPVSLRLIREIHEILMQGVRGQEKTPGEFRRSQNWIGPRGCTLQEAAFVPPPVYEMNQALDNLEKFIHYPGQYPPLIHCAMVHAQFETIHPFLDGNGRVGRLLITFMLCRQGILQRPLLYLSHYFKQYKPEYYGSLMDIRDQGNWEGWIRFFLAGVARVSEEAAQKARNIAEMIKNHKELIGRTFGNSSLGERLMEKLLLSPFVTSNHIQRDLNCSAATANKVIRKFTDADLLKQITPGKKNRVFVYAPYWELLDS